MTARQRAFGSFLSKPFPFGRGHTRAGHPQGGARWGAGGRCCLEPGAYAQQARRGKACLDAERIGQLAVRTPPVARQGGCCRGRATPRGLGRGRGRGAGAGEPMLGRALLCCGACARERLHGVLSWSSHAVLAVLVHVLQQGARLLALLHLKAQQRAHAHARPSLQAGLSTRHAATWQAHLKNRARPGPSSKAFCAARRRCASAVKAA